MTKHKTKRVPVPEDTSHLPGAEGKTAAEQFYFDHAVWTYEWMQKELWWTPLDHPLEVYPYFWGAFPTRCFSDDGQEIRCAALRNAKDMNDIKNYIKQSIRNMHIDLIRKRKRESRYLSKFSLDDSIGNGDPDDLLLSETVGAKDDFTSEADSHMDFSSLRQIIFEEVNKIPNELQHMVALHDMEFITDTEFNAYKEEHTIDDGSIRVARHRYHLILRRSKLMKYRDWLR